MAYKIKIGQLNNPTYEFGADEILSVNIALANSMISNELTIDQSEMLILEVGVQGFITADNKQLVTSDNKEFFTINSNHLGDILYGTPIYFIDDNTLICKFYVKNITRQTATTYTITSVSAVGLMDSMTHYGGIYTGQTVATVLQSIIPNEISYTVAQDIATEQVYGWLPIGTRRTSLQQLLFSLGGCLTKNADGSLNIYYLQNITPTEIEEQRTYLEGSVDYSEPATRVELTEHSFFALSTDVQETLFDNTDGSGSVTNKIITFNEPYHDLVASGVSISQSGANYCIVSGTGTVKGKKYTHTMQTLSHNTGIQSDEKVVSVTDATLITTLNSANAILRVADYFSQAKQVTIGLVAEEEKPADKITFVDPFEDTRTGFISEMEIAVSSIMKANTKVATNWTPSHFGSNYKHFEVITQSGTYTWTHENTNAKVIMVGGGNGGQGGYDGNNGSPASDVYQGSGRKATGGNGGSCGASGKVFSQVIAMHNGDTFAVTIGAGGSGGARGGNTGASGGNTTFGQYSSASGSVPTGGVLNPINGDIYARQGLDGVKGGDGGYPYDGNRGENVTVGTQTWYSGTYTPSGDGNRNHAGASGGASYGRNSESRVAENPNDQGTWSRGGAGANAIQRTEPLVYGQGGHGGNGGGGAGCGGYFYVVGELELPMHNGGYAGTGTAGTNGANGIVCILY